jgi:PAS domain S-box-containing protein
MNGMDSAASVFPGTGTMSDLFRGHDWAASPLGAPEQWPASLRIACQIALSSRFPMIVWWGPELRFLYNDPYIPLLGSKHPALDQPGEQVWPEIWHIIGPQLRSVLSSGEPTWSEDVLLPMNRHGYWEETYWTYSYSPVHNEDGTIGGVFTAVTDTTERVIGARRLSALQDLGAQAGTARTVAQACDLVAQTLRRAEADAPYFALYLNDLNGLSAGDGPGPALAAATAGGQEAAEPALWPLAEALTATGPVIVGDVADRIGELPRGGWATPPTQATVLRLQGDAGAEPIGALVLAASAGRRLDDDYVTFMELLARQTAALINGAIAYQAEQRRAEDLAELDRAKTTFFSNISHEFRTPLTLMLGPVQELRDRLGEADQDSREDLDVVYRNGLRMGKLVNALLDFSRIEAGRSQARYEPVDLAVFTADLASSFRAAFQRAGLTFEVDCAALGEPGYVDREMWEKVVLNLLSNALKFTFTGSVRLSLAPEDGQAVLRVADTGVGIPASDMPRLFERFHRGSRTQARSHEGSGIGLALVKELVALHGGAIEAESEPGAGTTFTVRVPLGRAHLAPASVVPAAEAGPATVDPAGVDPFVQEALRWLPGTLERGGPAGRDHAGSEPAGQPGETAPAPVMTSGTAVPDGALSVLVADDNADMREYLQRLLQSRYRVTATADGQAALDAARAAPPDLIISDVMMPGVDGLRLAEELRKDPRTAEVPLLLLSARAGQEAAVEGLAAGADDYLVKPFAARELLARVEASVRLTQLRSRQARWRAAMIESLQEGFFVLDQRGYVIEVNSGFERILGYGNDGAPYGFPRPWWPDPDTDPEGYQLTSAVYPAASEQVTSHFVVPLRHRLGHTIWGEVTYNTVEDPDGGQMMVGTLRDVTAERRAAHREAAVLAMAERLAVAATGQAVLETGLAELRRRWHAPRALAAAWPDGSPVVLASTPPGLRWADLPAPAQRSIESLRDQPPLQICTAAEAPTWAGTTVEHSGSAAAIWIDLDGCPPLGAEDRILLALLCGSLGQALSRARLLDQEREVALALQHAVLGPGRMPPGFAARYEPATPPLEIGGDWYDVAELPDGRVGIIVGDCVGRGLPAASVMGQLRSACRALLLDSRGPGAALAALDRFAALIPDALATTVFCGVLDPATGTLTYASAGHPPGILVLPDGTIKLLDEGRSLALALAPERPRGEATAQVPEGALLLLYTDGLVERRRVDMDVTTARAAALLQAGQQAPVSDLADTVMAGLAPPGGFEDDVALLVYRRPATLEVNFPADPDELAPVRRQLRGWLGQLSLDPLVTQDVLIAACEACANAIEHGYRGQRAGMVRLRAEASGPDLLLTVTDRGRWRPPRQLRERGHGLKLIRATMREVNITSGDAGTTVRMRTGRP